MAIMSNDKKAKLYVGNTRVKKVFAGDKRVYSAGNVCTYHVDGNTYQEEVDEGASCLSPISFIPQKDGWEFLGWRDSAMVGDALSEKVMGDDPVDLYAMFKHPDKNITTEYASWNNPSWPSDKTIYDGVEFDKYSSVTFKSGKMYLNVNFAAGRMYQLVRGSDGSSSIWSAIVLGGKNTTTNLANRGMGFGTNKGTGYLYVNYYIEDNSTIHAWIDGCSATLIGRTIVG